ncbi:MAG: DUF3791 domain-containing protein [Methanomicrobiales archaeon]|jgi:hypothetical protein|nr:DUF3791 domain-containing protein [Methanomicrobiales archaeon]
MIELEEEIWFFASCVELYKEEKGMSGREAFHYLLETGAMDFIIECSEGLHMTSHLYIIDSIDEFITNNLHKREILIS